MSGHITYLIPSGTLYLQENQYKTYLVPQPLFPQQGMILWWDAANASSISGAGVQVQGWSSVGGTLGVVKAEPHFADNYPFTGYRTLNGKPTITFLNNRNLNIRSTYGPITTFTYFVVYAYEQNTDEVYGPFGFGATSQSWHSTPLEERTSFVGPCINNITPISSSNTVICGWGSSSGDWSTFVGPRLQAIYPTWHISYVMVSEDWITTTLWSDGALTTKIGIANSHPFSMNLNLPTYDSIGGGIGGSWFVSNHAGPSLINYSIAEIIMYDNIPSQTDRDAIVKYLNDKWVVY